MYTLVHTLVSVYACVSLQSYILHSFEAKHKQEETKNAQLSALSEQKKFPMQVIFLTLAPKTDFLKANMYKIINFGYTKNRNM